MKLQIENKSAYLAAIMAAYPTARPKHIEAAIEEYIEAVELALLKGADFRTPYERKFDLYSLPLETLRNASKRIGPAKEWLHSILLKAAPIFRVVEKGTNINGKVSLVRFAQGITIIDNYGEDKVTDQETDIYLATGDDRELFAKLYPELMGDDYDEAEYDLVPIDIPSLTAYRDWVKTATYYDQPTKAQYMRQANTILAVARIMENHLVMKRKQSEFGRTYYNSLSIQSMNKEMRRAALGNSWEYDIRSAVISWKMGFAKAYAEQNELDLQHEFMATLAYLEEKAATTRQIQLDVFADADIDEATQKKMIKRSLTAISFGAKLKGNGWRDSNGDWTNPAIVEIIRIPEYRDRFITHPIVVRYVDEMAKLDDYIYAAALQHYPELKALPAVHTAARISKAKTLAYLYQHAETAAMDIIRAKLKQKGKTVLANIHDAIITRERLTVDDRYDIEQELRDQTDNPYWHITPSQLKGYYAVSEEQLTDEQAHRKFMRQQEEMAQRYATAKDQLGTERHYG